MKKSIFGAALVVIALVAGGVLKGAVAQETARADGLVIKDLSPGTGEEAVLHASVKVHYTGRLLDGTKFDSSLDRNEPFGFTIGFQQVIQGWELGVVGMRVGGKRELTIPPELAYGDRAAGELIPANSTLKFEIELLEVQGPGYGNVQPDGLAQLQKDGSKLVDIRDRAEWEETGVIEGAILLTAFAPSGQLLPSFPEHFEAAVSREDNVVLIGSNEDQRAPLLSLILVRRAGYPNVSNLQKGMEAWVAEGRDVIQPPAASEVETSPSDDSQSQ